MTLIKVHEPIKLEKIGPRQFRLLEDTTVFGVKIPAGYTTNGASVPRYFWWILGPFEEGFRAALVHDFRYSNCTNIMSRLDADTEFYYNLEKYGINILRRLAVYYAVRMFGGSVWGT